MKMPSILVVLLLAGPLAAQGPARLEHLTQLADQAASVAGQWLDGPWEDEALDDWIARRPLSDQLRTRIRLTTYDDASIEALRQVLSAARKDPVDLYVINCLIEPLLSAKTDIIRNALGVIEPYQRRAVYKKLPEYTQRQIEALKTADEKEQAKVAPARIEKLHKELPLQFHNEQAARLNRIVWQLMVFADEADRDRDLISQTASLERRGLWDYTAILSAVRTEINKMDKHRAARFYDAFKTQWLAILSRPKDQQTRPYADPASATLSVDNAPAGGLRKDRPATRLLQTLNLLATRAHLPALQTPKPRTTGKRAPDKRK